MFRKGSTSAACPQSWHCTGQLATFTLLWSLPLTQWRYTRWEVRGWGVGVSGLVGVCRGCGRPRVWLSVSHANSFELPEVGMWLPVWRLNGHVMQKSHYGDPPPPSPFPTEVERDFKEDSLVSPLPRRSTLSGQCLNWLAWCQHTAIGFLWQVWSVSSGGSMMFATEMHFAFCKNGNGCLTGWLLACLTPQQHATVSQGRICSDNSMHCHIKIEVADQTFHLTQSQYTDTGPTSPSADPIMPGAWHGRAATGVPNFKSLYDSTRKNPGPSGIRTQDLTLSRWTPQPLGQRRGCWNGNQPKKERRYSLAVVFVKGNTTVACVLTRPFGGQSLTFTSIWADLYPCVLAYKRWKGVRGKGVGVQCWKTTESSKWPKC